MTNQSDLPREAQSGPVFHPDWGTHAYAAYNASTTGLDALLAMVFPLLEETDRSRRFLVARRLKVENDYSGPWAIDVEHAMLSWQVAMRVAAVEVYLQDALTFLAVYDSDFMRSRGSRQTWDYDTARAASDADASLRTFCNRWARSFVADGGPRKWSKALSTSGLGAFAPTDVNSLEAMWGYRHIRVHNAGRIDRDYADRHPVTAQRIYRDGLDLKDVEAWSKVADGFVTSAEAGISGRLRARLGETLIAERQGAEFNRQVAWMEERYKAMKDSESSAELDARSATRSAKAENRFALMDELFSFEQSVTDHPSAPRTNHEDAV